MAASVIVFGTLITFSSYFINADKLSIFANNWARLNLFLLRLICGLKVKIVGWKHLPLDKPFIILAKHQSTWETIALRGILPSNQAWILKRELIKYPFFGNALKKTGQLAIDRSKGKAALKSLIDQGKHALLENKIIIVFPEGTRTTYGKDAKYHIGGALLAEKSQQDVIPVAHNAGYYWPKGFLIKPGIVELNFGKAISTINKDAKTINSITKDWIESTMESFNEPTK